VHGNEQDKIVTYCMTSTHCKYLGTRFVGHGSENSQLCSNSSVLACRCCQQYVTVIVIERMEGLRDYGAEVMK